MTSSYFFFVAPATSKIYTLSLHDALPISEGALGGCGDAGARAAGVAGRGAAGKALYSPARIFRPTSSDRKSTRLNSSHVEISYAVFCLKKKKEWRWPTSSRSLAISPPTRL